MHYLYSFIQKFIERIWKKSIGLKIYMFHQINDDKTKWKDKGVCITQSSFEIFIEGIQAKGYNFLALNELSLDKVNPNNVIITFDDIFQDAVNNAIPILIKKNIPFTIFVTENYIDSENFLTQDSLKKLMNEPLCTIGFHTRNHKLMRYLKGKELSKEIECSDFEKIIDKNVLFFAFPYGSIYACSLKSILNVKNKYLYAFSTISIPCSKRRFQKAPYFLPRINICETNYKKWMEEI